jgi:hypothetical protein
MGTIPRFAPARVGPYLVIRPMRNAPRQDLFRPSMKIPYLPSQGLFLFFKGRARVDFQIANFSSAWVPSLEIRPPPETEAKTSDAIIRCREVRFSD